MKIILVMVMSLDGKITRGEDSHIHTWTSVEDQQYFSSVIEKHNAIIMGRKTYITARSGMKLSPDRLRIVVTKNPEKYRKQEIPGQLEFTKNNPREIVHNLEKRGYTNALLVGGESLNTAFFKEKLIDELWVTIEPIIIGQGHELLSQMEFDTHLQLVRMEKLNQKGTLLLQYKVDK